MQFPPPTLAIDFGTKRIGLAISRGSLAEPLYTISNGPQLFRELQQVIEEEAVQQVVVGLSENEMANLTRQFVAELEQHISLPITLVDETLSSVVVTQKLRESGRNRIRQGTIDQYAAAEFLQDYLDSVADDILSE